MSDEAPRPHKPVLLGDFAAFDGGADPARVSEAAHLAAYALVHRGRSSHDPDVTERLVRLTDDQGLEAIAEMWAEAPARSLPGTLWRLYALRAATRRNPSQIALYFSKGKDTAQVSHVIAGAAEPPEANEIVTMADTILSGAFNGDFDVALERTAAFCRVVALGQTKVADDCETGNADHSSRLTHNAQRLIRTAEDLEYSARAWRRGELD